MYYTKYTTKPSLQDKSETNVRIRQIFLLITPGSAVVCVSMISSVTRHHWTLGPPIPNTIIRRRNHFYPSHCTLGVERKALLYFLLRYRLVSPERIP